MLVETTKVTYYYLCSHNYFKSWGNDLQNKILNVFIKKSKCLSVLLPSNVHECIAWRELIVRHINEKLVATDLYSYVFQSEDTF